MIIMITAKGFRAKGLRVRASRFGSSGSIGGNQRGSYQRGVCTSMFFPLIDVSSLVRVLLFP